MGAVSFDQSDKEIEEKRLFARRKGRQDARVGFAYLWQQGLERQLALASEIKLTSAPIGMVHTSLDKPLTLEQIGDETGVVSIDPDRVARRHCSMPGISATMRIVANSSCTMPLSASASANSEAQICWSRRARGAGYFGSGMSALPGSACRSDRELRLSLIPLSPPVVWPELFFH